MTPINVPNHLRFNVNCSILFTELDLVDRPAAAAAAGFGAIELWWPFSEPVPNDRAVDDLLRRIDDAGVELVALNFYAGDMPGGERGVVSVPGREQQFRDSVPVLVSMAERTGCRRFNALFGHRVDGATPEQQDELAVENLVFAANAVAGLGGTVLVEPLASGENGPYPLLTAADVLSVVDRVTTAGAANVAMLADLYHLAKNGEDVAQVVTAHATRFAHVQIADPPNRNEPGTGELDWSRLFGLLADQHYDGYVGLEYRASAGTVESFGWLPQERRAGKP